MMIENYIWFAQVAINKKQNKNKKSKDVIFHTVPWLWAEVFQSHDTHNESVSPLCELGYMGTSTPFRLMVAHFS